jgi:lipoprotein NlpD
MLKLIIFFAMALLTACSNNISAPVNNAWNDVITTQTNYTVQAGDTLPSIAWRFNLTIEQLAQYNHLQTPYNLHIGQVIRLKQPAGTATFSAPTTAPTSSAAAIDEKPSFTPVQSTDIKATPSFSKPTQKATAHPSTQPIVTSPSKPVKIESEGTWAWPIKGKQIRGYGDEGSKGLDIATPIGTKVKAVQPGTVVYAGANLHGYGKLVIVKQQDDLMTAYAHNSQLLVTEGSKVSAGQVLALSGDTEAPQPMLHFEVRKTGKPVDPTKYLKSESL